MKKKNRWGKWAWIFLGVLSVIFLCTVWFFIQYPILYPAQEFRNGRVFKTRPISQLQRQRELRKKIKVYSNVEKRVRLESENRRIHFLRTTIFDPFWQGFQLNQTTLSYPQEGPPARPLYRLTPKGELLYGLAQLALKHPTDGGVSLYEGVFLWEQSKLIFQTPRRHLTRYIRFDVIPITAGEMTITLGEFQKIVSFDPKQFWSHFDLPLHDHAVHEVSFSISKGSVWLLNPQVTVTVEQGKLPLIYHHPWYVRSEYESLDTETSFQALSIPDPLEYQQWTPPELGETLKAFGYNVVWVRTPHTESHKDLRSLEGARRFQLTHEPSADYAFVHQILGQRVQIFDRSTLGLNLQKNRQNFYKRFRLYGYYVGSIQAQEDLRLPLEDLRAFQNPFSNLEYQDLDWQAHECHVVSRQDPNYVLKQMFHHLEWLKNHHKKRFLLHVNLNPFPFLPTHDFQAFWHGHYKKQRYQNPAQTNDLIEHIVENLHGFYLHHRTILVVEVPTSQGVFVFLKLPGLVWPDLSETQLKRSAFIEQLLSWIACPDTDESAHSFFSKFYLSMDVHNIPVDNRLSFIWDAVHPIQHVHARAREYVDMVGHHRLLVWPFEHSGHNELTWYQKMDDVEKQILQEVDWGKKNRLLHHALVSFLGGLLSVHHEGDNSQLNFLTNCHIHCQVGEGYNCLDPFMFSKMISREDIHSFYTPLDRLRLDRSLNVRRSTQFSACAIVIQLKRSFIQIPT